MKFSSINLNATSAFGYFGYRRIHNSLAPTSHRLPKHAENHFQDTGVGGLQVVSQLCCLRLDPLCKKKEPEGSSFLRSSDLIYLLFLHPSPL